MGNIWQSSSLFGSKKRQMALTLFCTWKFSVAVDIRKCNAIFGLSRWFWLSVVGCYGWYDGRNLWYRDAGRGGLVFTWTRRFPLMEANCSNHSAKEVLDWRLSPQGWTHSSWKQHHSVQLISEARITTPINHYIDPPISYAGVAGSIPVQSLVHQAVIILVSFYSPLPNPLLVCEVFSWVISAVAKNFRVSGFNILLWSERYL